MHRPHGFSLAESLVTVAIAGMAILVALPSAATVLNAGRLAAGTRELVLTLQGLRWESVAKSRAHGLLFRKDDKGWYWIVVRDGNGNGLRTAEVARGVDATVSGPHRLEERVRGVTPGFPPGRTFPAIPPRPGTLEGGGDPVRFGRSDLVSFSPLGTSSSGTLYLTDGTGMLSALSIFGPTARVRVWRFDERKEAWVR
jgi:prepilin-type N-terminal cleavage/methylation domain-containing protein